MRALRGMESLKKTLRSNGSYKSSSRNASFELGGGDHEEQPILSDHRTEEGGNVGSFHADRREVVVKIDGNGRDPSPSASPPVSGVSIWREPSYDFWSDAHSPAPVAGAGAGGGGNVVARDSGFTFSMNRGSGAGGGMMEAGEGDDPPSRLINKFLNKQRAAGGEVSLDVDLEMDELKHVPSSATASKETRVSFQEAAQPGGSSSSASSSEDERSLHRRSAAPSTVAAAEVLRCSSNASFRKATSSLLRTKTRSRLMDPPPPVVAPVADRPPARSGQLKSGFLGRPDEDDEDPFMDVDVPPDDFTRVKLDALTVVQWLSLVLILAALTCSLTIPRLCRKTMWGLHLWEWEVFVLVLICGRLVSGWAIRIAVFFIERNFLLRKRVLYFVYGLRKAVQNCLWLALVIVAWHSMFDKKLEATEPGLRYITKILFCLLVATILRLIKTLLLKVLASSFHVSTYFDRIQESLFNQFVIETLSGPPTIELKNTREEEERIYAEVQKLQNAGARIPNDLRAAAFPPTMSGRVIGGSGHNANSRNLQAGKSVRFSGSVTRKDFSRQIDRQPMEDGISIDHLHKLNQKNVSAWNMKRLMRIVRHGTLMTLDEQIPQSAAEDESLMQIRSECEAKVAARKIFNNVSRPGSKYIYLSDLMRFMRDEEAQKAMSLFEGAHEHKRVSRRSLKNWVVSAFRERRALSLTLNDTKTAVDKLHQLANIVVGIIVLGLWLLILGIATMHFFVLISSQVLVAVFMFGNTLKLIFEAIIFLFVMHPFDVGDRCEINGVQMIVEEMNILTTVFLRYDNQKMIYPNSVLAALPIGNIYRSPDMGDAIDFCVHVSTPVEKLAIMKDRIKGYIQSKPEHWQPSPSVVLRDVDDMNRLKVSVWLGHKMNFQDMGERWLRRELVLQEMVKVLRELDIEYRMLPLDVNVRDMPAITSARLPSTWTTCI